VPLVPELRRIHRYRGGAAWEKLVADDDVGGLKLQLASSAASATSRGLHKSSFGSGRT
jgi:hypothetical protein